MTDPGAMPPPPSAAPPSDPAQRRKRVAIGINVVLLLAIAAAIILVDRGEDTSDAVATARTTTTTSPRRIDDSDAFVLGMQAGATATTEPRAGGAGNGDDPSDAVNQPATTATTSLTTTTVARPPELTGELDEDGIPIGLEFPLYNSEHTIIGGENLWLIAANQLAAITERELNEVSQTQIAIYWERVIDTNRSNLRSGNPDLVYPGEVVKFPGA